MTTTQKTTDVTARRCSHWWWTVPGCLAMVLLNAAVSYGIVRLNAPVTVAFNMKQTVDAFFDSASQKQLSEAQSKALSARFNTALEASLQAWQQKHHAVILVSPAVVQGHRISPGNPAGYRPANEGGTMRCRGLIALLIWGRV
ncbi:conjugal transfer protein TrbI [Escherichia coli]|nr:conjugal transfer protein TrbI [Escherichia coli]